MRTTRKDVKQGQNLFHATYCTLPYFSSTLFLCHRFLHLTRCQNPNTFIYNITYLFILWPCVFFGIIMTLRYFIRHYFFLLSCSCFLQLTDVTQKSEPFLPYCIVLYEQNFVLCLILWWSSRIEWINRVHLYCTVL